MPCYKEGQSPNFHQLQTVPHPYHWLSMALQLLGNIFLAVVAWAIYKFRNLGTREPGLPPGPPTTPLLGNIAHFPTSYPYLR